MPLMIGIGAEARPAQVFVACLPYSGDIYAEATQRSEDWLASHVRLLEHLGGVPARLVPDNLKVGVSHASFYDPTINPGYHDLAQHYRLAVVPTRVRQPRGALANAEGGTRRRSRMRFCRSNGACWPRHRFRQPRRRQCRDPRPFGRAERSTAERRQDHPGSWPSGSAPICGRCRLRPGRLEPLQAITMS
jgi:transposase